MTDIVTRKLASVQKIAEIKPIEGADKIEAVRVNGWWMVTQKSNNFKVGDLVIYFEVDSFLPVCPAFEFLRPACFKSTQHLGDGFRLRTIKLKGQVSQGLVLPMDTFFSWSNRDCNWYNGTDVNYLREGDDLTELLKVKKWETPLPPQLAGKAKGNFPSFIRKTDQERIQNVYDNLLKTDYVDQEFEKTLKLDGSSMTVYLNDGVFGVCSRNLDLLETEDNTFWQVARKGKLEEMMRSLNAASNFAIQGELMGPGVQGNREGFRDHMFCIFDIWNIDTQGYLAPETRDDIILLWKMKGFDASLVPYLGKDKVLLKPLDEILATSEIKSINHPIAEGIVYRSMDGKVSFKVINNQFLLKEK